MAQVPSSLPPSVPCPNAVAATNAQATTKGAIMFLTNFVFISVISFHCFGLPWLPTVGGHFWPFTGVQNGNQREVTPKTGSPREIVKSLKRRDHGITACPLSCGVAGGNFSNSKRYLDIAVLP